MSYVRNFMYLSDIMEKALKRLDKDHIHYMIETEPTMKGRVKLPKLKMVKAKQPREFEGQIKSATISQMPSGKYFVSILVEEEQVELPKVEKSVGIDLGIKDLVITSDGEKSII